MNAPMVYLINRGLTEDKIERLKSLLSLTPLQAIAVTSPQDADYARTLDLQPELVSLLHRPIAVIGDFQNDCTALGEGPPCRLL